MKMLHEPFCHGFTIWISDMSCSLSMLIFCPHCLRVIFNHGKMIEELSGVVLFCLMLCFCFESSEDKITSLIYKLFVPYQPLWESN